MVYVLLPLILIAFIAVLVLYCRKKRGERERFASAYKESVIGKGDGGDKAS